jgi:hypothetical protein
VAIQHETAKLLYSVRVMRLLGINYSAFLVMSAWADYTNWDTAHIGKCDYTLTCYTTKYTVSHLFC